MRPRSALIVLCALCAVSVLCSAPAAEAQPTGYYAPQIPTKGALYTDGQDNRYLLGGMWLYRSDPTDVGVTQGFYADTSSPAGWTALSVPNSYNAGDFSSASMAGSVGWYRRDFVLPSGAFTSYVPANARRWILHFESVNYYAEVWINGQELGTHGGAFLPFELDLRYLHSGVNRLVVRVDDRRPPTAFPAGPGGGWWNFGGILREVYLRAVQRADISQAMVRPRLPCISCAATIEEQASVRNLTASSQTVALKGTYGGSKLSFGSATIAPGATWTPSASVRIAHPHLWTIRDPYLYRARMVLSDSKGRVLGGYTVLSGVRTIAVVGGHVQLNGRNLYLRGVNIHEQDMTEGGAITATQLSNEIGWMRQLGATVLRAHYPLNQQTLEAADRNGILVWSEIPVYGVQAQYFGQPSWDTSALALLRENIVDNQNHPSVMLWSIGNEFPTPATPGEAQYVQVAAALSHQLDPTRPVGMAIASWPGVACQTAYAPLDAIGFNDYFGWFDAGGGTTDDRDALGPYLDFLHSCYPSKGLFVTEFGFEGSRPGPVEERGTYAYQMNSLSFHLGVFDSKSYLSGAMYFAMQDFAARPGWTGGDPGVHPPFVEKGVVDLYGNEKASFAVMSASYHALTQIARDTSRGRRHSAAADLSGTAGSPAAVFGPLP
ncbi:MAG: glycoside hydrolase family 2 protein [Solirubrobacteraceae bacterium]